MFKAEVKIMLRPAILDVQGKTVENALHSLQHTSVGHVRIGKHVTMQIDVPTRGEAERVAREVASTVLSNPIMEDFEIAAVEELAEATR